MKTLNSYLMINACRNHDFVLADCSENVAQSYSLSGELPLVNNRPFID